MESGEDLKLTLIEDEQKYDWNSFSGGEKKRVAIAIRCALWTYLLEHNCSLNFGLFDEVLGGLDPPGRERALRLFESLADKYDAQIFLISHFPVEDLALDWNRIVVQRKDGVSKFISR